ncbi:unnamed protein product [Oncorhynchus mykiss]|uniref:Protein-tyrosine phosphatase receptor IA-2 ectodomain domain-containing protein n=1 Tax=Oncorhynchus mykiss TaxID=8022 RepID=A0A060VME9_ONCMY|nr:unnamed protein product [Oncorhynchus mykiss]
MDPFSDAPDAKLEVGDAGGAAGNPSIKGQRTVGLENVRSRTTQGQVPVPHPWEERSMTMGGEDGAPDQPDDGTSDQPVDVQGSDSLVDSEVERWMYGTEAPSPPAAETDLLAEEPQGRNLLAEPQKKDMRLQEEVVHMGVKAYSKSPQGKDHHSDIGYIITDTDSLTSDQGLDLMERLGRRVNLHLTDLLHLSYVLQDTHTRTCTNAHIRL